jgi:MtN3 and saliva related transmembrane protein
MIGYCAAFLTTAAFIPQAIHSWKTKDLSSISLSMYLMFTIGVAMWLWYGFVTESWPVVIANGITLVISTSILYLKIKIDYF